MIIDAQNISHKYNKQKVISDISFGVDHGEVFGIIGPNGSGKTTIIKTIAGYQPPSDGKVFIFGYDHYFFTNQTRMLIGYLPEHNPIYPNMYVSEYLTFIGKCYNMPHELIRHRIIELIDKFDIKSTEKKKLGKLSKGFKQRVGLVRALLHDPKVLILDEPMTGIDITNVSEICKILKELSENKATIISSHKTSVIESLCDRVMVMDNGTPIIEKKITELYKQAEPQIILKIKEKIDPAIFLDIEGISNSEYKKEHVFLRLSKKNKSTVKKKKLIDINKPIEKKLDSSNIENLDPMMEKVYQLIKKKNLTLLKFTTEREMNLEEILTSLTRRERCKI